MENHEAGPTEEELSKSEISGQHQSQGVGPTWDRNASKRLRRTWLYLQGAQLGRRL